MNTDDLRLICADAVVPMEGRGEGILERGGVVVGGGRIMGVGTVRALREQFGALSEEYVAGVMLPGLVNAHTHLELGYQRAPVERPAYFTDWVGMLMRNYPEPEALERVVTKAMREGVAESLRAGVTTVGDISRHCALTRRILSAGPLRVVSFGEVIGLGKMRERRTAYAEAAVDRTFESATLTAGLSPHAPYTTEGPTLKQVVELAVAGGYPVTMHVAELREEADFLRDGGGRLGDWAVMKNIMDAEVPQFAGGPMRWAEEWGLLGENGAAKKVPVVLAHVNYCDDAELAILTKSGASVAYCPRTRAYFGHDDLQSHLGANEHRYREMLAAGVNVCLGTDSSASNPDLSVLREAALLSHRDELGAYEAMELVTRRGANALGLDAGVLAAGMLADIVIFPGRAAATVEDTLKGILQAGGEAVAVWVGGARVV